MTTKSGELFDAVVSAGTQYTSDIINHRKDGFRIAVLVNQGSETLAATLSLEGWDKDLATWIPEPMAIFLQQPAGVKAELTDTFKTTHAEKYRIAIEHTGGTGPIKISWSHAF